MPVYEYECTQCGEVEEVIQNFSDKPLTKCRYCTGKLQKLISQSTFHLKGTGWYVTDYSHKSQGFSASCKAKDKDKASISKTDKPAKSTEKND
ncbi:MAG: zinc ribbon domain-containing protein [Elusimicrobiota bacterium]|nr:zinc ribbon domain-containing protein [Elusimicrobiota bacterium]